VPQLLQEVTFTAEYRFDDGVLLRGELRRDWSDVPFFVGEDPSSPQESQSTLLIGMVWWIGGKKGPGNDDRAHVRDGNRRVRSDAGIYFPVRKGVKP
jgi:hypothetical protein